MIWRILVVDDHEVVRIGIRSLLAEDQDITVCSEAEDGLDAIVKYRACNPDIVILDDELPKINGMAVAQRILQWRPLQRIVVFGTMHSDLIAQQFLELGIRSLVWKTDPASDLLSAVRAVQRNRLYFTKTVDDLVLRGYFGAGSRTASVDNDEELTLREREVTQLIVEGRSTKEVAVTLNISVKTAETHRQNAMAKLGLHSVVQLTRYAIENGILPSLRGGSLLDISSDRQLQPGPKLLQFAKKVAKANAA